MLEPDNVGELQPEEVKSIGDTDDVNVGDETLEATAIAERDLARLRKRPGTDADDGAIASLPRSRVEGRIAKPRVHRSPKSSRS